jgi:pimeloyl-ACP methyl ester carboxylesterase
MPRAARFVSSSAAALVLVVSASIARAELAHDTVDGAPIAALELAGPGAAAQRVAFADLAAAKAPGPYTLRFAAKGEALLVPHCAGRARVLVDGGVKGSGSKGPLVVKLGGDAEHEVRVEIDASTYEKRIACAEPPRAGAIVSTREGTTLLRFTSPNAKKHPDAGQAVVFVPKGHDTKKAGPLLVGVHPWNGGPWTYAAYAELLEEAQAKDVVLLMPSGLGNSLYTADAEEEVMRAIDAVSAEVAVDKQRVSIWGASMGGAGATTISFHRPDRFAFVASYFGDSKYDLTTYVKGILGGEAGAHRVNALDVVENARHLPVWLIHGEDDRTSPIAQSAMLFDAMKRAGFAVDFDRVPGMAHEARLVVKYLRKVVDRAADARAPLHPSHVTFRSVRGVDTEAYGVRLVRASEADAFVDVEKKEDGIVVHRTEGVLQIVLRPGALGAKEGDFIRFDTPGPNIAVRWGS